MSKSCNLEKKRDVHWSGEPWYPWRALWWLFFASQYEKSCHLTGLYEFSEEDGMLGWQGASDTAMAPVMKAEPE